MRYLIALLAFVGLSANAATITWTNPTQYTDGSPLVAADIASTVVEWSATQTFVAQIGSVIVNGSATTATAPDPPAGQTWYYRARTTVIAAKGGGQSAPSNVASKTTPFSPPNPPSNLTVQANNTAWTIVQSRDRVALVAVGTVATGTACDASQPVLDKWVVPRAAVTFVGTVRPEVVLAACS